jgi:hypothetical protein
MKESFYNDLVFLNDITESCDYYWPNFGERYINRYKNIMKGLDDFENIEENSIIWADLYYLKEFYVFNSLKVPFILVSGDCDACVPYNDSKNKNSDHSKIAFSLLNNKNLIAWYSTNVDYKHPKLKNIPIGIVKHIPFYNKKHILWNVLPLTSDVKYFMHNFLPIYSTKVNFQNKEKELLFSRMTVKNSTNTFHEFENIRQNILNILKINGFNFKDLNTELTYWTEYIRELCNYKFCLSLPGKGLDCYRTWEALAVGCIPIVLSNHLNSLYEDLPVLVVDDFSIITPEFLEKQFEKITENVNNYNWEKLTSSFWIQKIKSSLKSRIMKPLCNFEITKKHIEYSLKNADENKSKLNEKMLNINHCTGNKIRHFINNLCSLDNCRYLEINNTGHCGITLASTYNNKIKNSFFTNTKDFLKDSKKETYNTIFLDCAMYYQEQYDIIKEIIPFLEDGCIFIVDDYNWENLRNATKKAFNDFNIKILYEKEIFTKEPHYNQVGKENWWNGLGIFILNS